ncbi:hypothetical protein DNTS_004271 [Danionella cerebrum]|uniref:Protein Wnt n=1 Tax=Danionella cerebrum TaxID=2873325 RepID=A0A553MS82_9TELE|nr:hypothetical protein DNTS_004271 [Danionella translucida]
MNRGWLMCNGMDDGRQVHAGALCEKAAVVHSSVREIGAVIVLRPAGFLRSLALGQQYSSLGSQPILCGSIPGLVPKQLRFCRNYIEIMPSVAEGVKLGIQECQHQFRGRRWNCTTIKDNLAIFGPVLDKGGGGGQSFWECQPLLWAELNWVMGCRVLGSFVWIIQCDNTETMVDSSTQQVAGAVLFLGLGQGSWGPELTVCCCGDPAGPARTNWASFWLEKQRATRESAFVHAIASAGVAFAVTRSCAEGTSTMCGCDSHHKGPPGEGWKWGGCSEDAEFGVLVSREFADARENRPDARSAMNRHNNEAGRMHRMGGISTEMMKTLMINRKTPVRVSVGGQTICQVEQFTYLGRTIDKEGGTDVDRIGKVTILENMHLRCKCHGLSGSCEVKTCWWAQPDFRLLGDYLKDKYDSASEMVVEKHRESRGWVETLRAKYAFFKHPTERDLVYYEGSPNFCEPNPETGSFGTRDRACNVSSHGIEGCDLLCCGRGHNTRTEKRKEKCHCIFHWCCYVSCQECVRVYDVHTCK